jgi:steroid 5-alpha reductase family enzyme
VDYRVGRGLAGSSRATGFALVGVTYLVAGGVAWAISKTHHHPLTVAFWADVAATLVVFLTSMLVGNSSLYDPYWSVAPPVIVLAWTTNGARPILVDVLVLAWAIRLTANWARGWRGLGHEDWRYVQIREQNKAPWWLVSLTGIQLMPTLTVFAGLLAVWPAFTTTRPINVIDVLAGVVTVAAIALEATADIQLRRFTRDPANRGKVADRGLWRISRHPNYLGEIAFWWGLWLFGLAAAPSWWWTVAGPIVMVLLFALVSVPLMDKRSLARRPAYAEYMRRVPALLPRPGASGLTGSR